MCMLGRKKIISININHRKEGDLKTNYTGEPHTINWALLLMYVQYTVSLLD